MSFQLRNALGDYSHLDSRVLKAAAYFAEAFMNGFHTFMASLRLGRSKRVFAASGLMAEAIHASPLGRSLGSTGIIGSSDFIKAVIGFVPDGVGAQAWEFLNVAASM